MVACGRGHEHIVRRLSQVTGIQLNTRYDRGYTALHLAVDYDNLATVSVLRGLAGVDWYVRDNRGSYPLTNAEECSHVECLDILPSVPEPHLDLGVTDYRGRNLARIAVEEDRGDRTKCLEFLSGDRRVDCYWNIKNSDGVTPMMFYLKYTDTFLATALLINPSLDLHTVDRDGQYREDIARLLDRADILSMSVLSTFTTVRKRKISEKKSFPSLQSLARDFALLALISNNQEERKVVPLVARETLLA